MLMVPGLLGHRLGGGWFAGEGPAFVAGWRMDSSPGNDELGEYVPGLRGRIPLGCGGHTRLTTGQNEPGSLSPLSVAIRCPLSQGTVLRNRLTCWSCRLEPRLQWTDRPAAMTMTGASDGTSFRVDGAIILQTRGQDSAI